MSTADRPPFEWQIIIPGETAEGFPVPVGLPPDALAVEHDLVIHAPAESGDGALCGRLTSPSKITVREFVDWADCPTCRKRLCAIG